MSQAISPNWHVILIHYPIALVTLGFLVELLSMFYRRSTARVAARWMILLGAAGCMTAMTTGLYALRDVASVEHGLVGAGLPSDGYHWLEVVHDSPLTRQAWTMMQRHLVSNGIGTGLLAIVVVTYLGCSDRMRRRLYLPLLLLVALAIASITFGAWNGGESIYRHGVAVQIQPVQEEWSSLPDVKSKAQWIVPPLQLHVFLAGLVDAVGLVALGLSIRGIVLNCHRDTVIEPTTVPVETIPSTATDTAMPLEFSAPPRGIVPAPMSEPLTPMEDDLAAPLVRARPPVQRVPAGAWWLIGCLLAICTVVAGLWAAGWWDLKDIRKDLFPPATDKHIRHFTHTVCGVAIVIATLILSILGRWGRTKKWAFAICAFLLLLAIGFQTLSGVLMLYDTPKGGLWGWFVP